MKSLMLLNHLAIALIRFYQKVLSPLIGPSCKYIPTCSHYAVEAFNRHTFFYALWLTVWRVLRCNPFSKGGYDPVPPASLKNNKFSNNSNESAHG